MPEKNKKELDLTIYTKSGKLRKRKPKKSVEYFNKETEDAIVLYLKTESQMERNRIYKKYIEHSFYKLAENIIHTFKFYYTELDDIEDLKHEVITFLIEKLYRYDQSLGKAYSFFGTIAKRYLIVYNVTNYKKLKLKATIEEVDEDKKTYNEIINIDYNSDLYQFIENYIKHIEKNINKYFPEEKEQDIVFAILEIFKKRESLEIFNKQHFYFFVREITGQSTPYITKIVKSMKKIYKDLLNVMYNEGELDVDEPYYLKN